MYYESIDEERDTEGVESALSPCEAKFFTVGIVLGVPVDQLEAIKNASQVDATTKLGQVISDFLKLDHPNPPTWQTIVDALKKGIHPKLASGMSYLA